MNKIYIIHENEDWLIPLRKELKKLHLAYEEWFIDELTLDLNGTPPEGIFYNRMSASAHTRDHRYAPEMTANIIAWLERHGRQVVNGRKALQLELRKSEQYISLQQHGIKHPKTIIANGVGSLSRAVDRLDAYPFILKPNRGGKGTGVQLFHSKESLDLSIKNKQIGESLDGIWLVQEYIKPANGRIVRAEFVGEKLVYAVSIDASNGFELCPADACNIEDAFCPANGDLAAEKFIVLTDYHNQDLQKYRSFLDANDIGIGALEYAEDIHGVKWVYDVNTNTNYNSTAEKNAGLEHGGMYAIAEYLGSLLTAEEQAKQELHAELCS